MALQDLASKGARSSIQRRLMLSFLVTTGAALALSSGAFFVTEYHRFRDEMVTNLTTLSRVMGANTAASLRFDDGITAEDTLRALEAEPHVIEALVYDGFGNPFARYQRHGSSASELPELPELGSRFGAASLDLAEPIIDDGERLGTLYIRSDTARLGEFTRLFGGIVGLVFVAASGVCWLGARRLRAEIAAPLAALVEVAGRLESGDLAARAPVGRADETGTLAGAFNAMAASLRSLVGEVGRNTGAVMDVASTLDESSQGMQSESARQEQAVEDAAESIERITSSLHEVNQSVESLSVAANQSSTAAMQMQSSVADTSVHMDRLSETVDGVASSVVEMTNAIREIAESAETLNTSTESTSSSVGELVTSVAQVETNARETGELSAKASAEAERGVASVRENLDSMRAIQESFGRIQNVIGDLDRKSSSIGEIVKVIQQVVEQTNLLALNAAIISAQAGQQGRAFGVVADEVKSLADTTAGSTKEIAALIQDLQAGIADAVDAMGQSSKRVERGVALSEEAAEILQALGESSHQSSRKVHEIVDATEAQSRELGAVDGDMKRLREVALLVNRATHEQDNAGRDIARGVEDLRDSSQNVQQVAQEQSEEARQITDSIASVATRTQEILSSTKDQSKQAAQILEALQVFRDVTVQSAQRAEQTRENVQELSHQAQSLDQEVRRFRL